MDISETKGQGWRVKEGQWYININHGRLFVQQPPKKGKGSRGSHPTWQMSGTILVEWEGIGKARK